LNLLIFDVPSAVISTSMPGLPWPWTDYARIEEFLGSSFSMNVPVVKQIPPEEAYGQRFKEVATGTNLSALLPTYAKSGAKSRFAPDRGQMAEGSKNNALRNSP